MAWGDVEDDLSEVVEDFGEPVTYRRNVDGAFNVATGIQAVTPADTAMQAQVNRSFTDGAGGVGGRSIERRQFLITRARFTTAGFDPAEDDHIVDDFDDTVWDVVTIEPENSNRVYRISCQRTRV